MTAATLFSSPGGPVFPGALPDGFDPGRSTVFAGPCGAGKTEACRAAIARWREYGPAVHVVDAVKLTGRWGVDAAHMATGVREATELLTSARDSRASLVWRRVAAPVVVVVEELPWMLEHAGKPFTDLLLNLTNRNQPGAVVYGTAGRIMAKHFSPLLLSRFQVVEAGYPAAPRLAGALQAA